MKRLFGGIMVAVGVLLMTGSGLCSLAVIGSSLQAGSRGDLSIIPLALIVGAIPFGMGFVGVWFGRTLIREADDDAPG